MKSSHLLRLHCVIPENKDILLYHHHAAIKIWKLNRDVTGVQSSDPIHISPVVLVLSFAAGGSSSGAWAAFSSLFLSPVWNSSLICPWLSWSRRIWRLQLFVLCPTSWCFLVIRFSISIFGRNIAEVTLCSHCILSDGLQFCCVSLRMLLLWTLD